MTHGDVLERVIGVSCGQYHDAALADSVESWEGRVEVSCGQAMMGLQRGYAVLSFNGKNAFNSTGRSRMLPALVNIVPPISAIRPRRSFSFT